MLREQSQNSPQAARIREKFTQFQRSVSHSITREESKEFLECLEFLAFNMVENNLLEVNKARITRWLFRPKRKVVNPRRINFKDNTLNATTFLVLAKQKGLLTENEGSIQFERPSLQTNFCLYYCFSKSFSLYLLSQMAEVQFKEIWKLWSIVDTSLTGKLVHALQDYVHSIVRSQAAIALGMTEDSQAVEPLIWALGDENKEVRLSAIAALAMLSPDLTIEPLVKALYNFNWPKRHWAAKVLGEIEDIRIVEPLIEAMDDKNPEVRTQAAIALNKQREIITVEVLLKALRNPAISVQAMAAAALGRSEDETALPDLIWLRDNDKNQTYRGIRIRDIAQRAIDQINQKQNQEAES